MNLLEFKKFAELKKQYKFIFIESNEKEYFNIDSIVFKLPKAEKIQTLFDEQTYIKPNFSFDNLKFESQLYINYDQISTFMQDEDCLYYTVVNASEATIKSCVEILEFLNIYSFIKIKDEFNAPLELLNDLFYEVKLKSAEIQKVSFDLIRELPISINEKEKQLQESIVRLLVALSLCSTEFKLKFKIDDVLTTLTEALCVSFVHISAKEKEKIITTITQALRFKVDTQYLKLNNEFSFLLLRDVFNLCVSFNINSAIFSSLLNLTDAYAFNINEHENLKEETGIHIVEQAQVLKFSIEEKEILEQNIPLFCLIPSLVFHIMLKDEANINAKLNVLLPEEVLYMNIKQLEEFYATAILEYLWATQFCIQESIRASCMSIIKVVSWAKLIDYKETKLYQMDEKTIEDLWFIEH